MKIALAQQNYHIGNFEENTRKAIEAIKKAKNDGADIIVFTELSICGYPPRDFLEFEDFINKCDQAINEIKQHADTIAVIVGAPQRNTISEGKSLFNAAWFLYEKEVLATTQKTLLPTYDVFDENRYFEPAYQWNVIPFKGKKIALTICEDIWNLGDNPLYRICPMDILMEQSPDLMLNISASPFDYDHDDDRKEVIRANVLKYKLPIFYCNAVGSQTEIVFDGGSLVMNAQGRIVKELAYFKEDYFVYDSEDFARDSGSTSGPLNPDRQFDKEMRVFKMNDPARIMEYMIAEKNIGEIHQALILGIRDYFSKLGFTKAILGSSGGIDSAVTLALAVEAIGHENVRAVLLPSQYSTSHSVTDAELLSQRLNNPYEIIEIKNVYESLMTALKPAFKDLPFSVAEENLQSRTRGNILMAIANKFGYILLNTSNKSELATGYGTLYGDMAGGLSVLGDVYKTQVYALARYINKNKEIIPANIIEKAPSAELRPNQRDSDSLPDYSILDKILYQYIEKRQGPKDIIGMDIDEAVVNKTLKLVNTNEYKRNQFCPIIRVSCKAFGVGRRMPIVGKYLS
ncbi:NAD+ synthase [Flavitalea sp.]|nr:NAD+ synthase [Flavitalea sp.]